MTLVSGEVWSGLLGDLSRQLSPQEIDTWIRPLRLAANGDPTSVRLEAPNQFHLQYVQDKFSPLLQVSIQSKLGPDSRVDIVLGNGHSSDAPVEEAPPAFTSAPVEPEFDEYQSALSRATKPVNAGAPQRESTPLNPKYTFEHFVVGKSNQFANAAARAVAEHPATAYNPLFFFGGSGLGKTHVMQAIGNHIRANGSPNTMVHYSSAESFMNEMIGSIQSGTTMAFRNKYRKIDVLLIDDVHFLQGKESTQEEFFHTFNALYDAHKQIVLTSDRPPKEIPTLEERLVSRFEWGLVTDIQPPDLETRIAILRNRAQDDNLEIPDEVLEFIASNVRSNIRELEGSLIRLLAFSSLTDSEIDLELTREVLKDFLKRPERIVTVEHIQRLVADHYGIPEEAMKVKKRTSSLAYPRQIAMFLSRELTKLSLSEIGSRFGGRDHTTVMHACDKIGTARDEDPQLRQILQRLTSTLQA
ncbi:MAG: chromosomal replication initiation protein DnaA [Gemmatimonadota bacterium]|nr:MAG: chromosomal replication initiation protein DnaA [Gemmatimonadota bacterium]